MLGIDNMFLKRWLKTRGDEQNLRVCLPSLTFPSEFIAMKAKEIRGNPQILRQDPMLAHNTSGSDVKNR